MLTTKQKHRETGRNPAVEKPVNRMSKILTDSESTWVILIMKFTPWPGEQKKRKKILITVFMWFTVQWIQKPSNQFNNFSFSSRKQHIINWPLWTALGCPKHYGKYGLYLPNRMISKIGPVGIGKFVYTFAHSISSQQSKRYISALS